MRTLEFAVLTAVFTLGRYAGQLSFLASMAFACGALWIACVAAEWRHRTAFQRIADWRGDRVLAFGQPTGVFGNPMPYSCWRHRKWHTAIVMSADGETREYCVIAEGTLVGLFGISIWCEPA